MRRAFLSCLTLLALLLIVVSCRSAADTKTSETQRQFGVRMAKMNLWREAMFRFQRAVQLDPEGAQAHNNLAVAYEANGDFDKAADEYKIAMRLDKSNQYIQKNYSRLVEFQQRNKKRQQQQAARAAASASAPATATSTTATPVSMPPATVPPATTTTEPTTPPASTATAPQGAAR
jgi:Tfp pilus assembly protein PilF